MEKDLQKNSDSAISIRHELRAGDIGCIIYLHGTLYSKEEGWDHTLEAYVAESLAHFAKSHSSSERIWIVEKDKRVVGSIAIVKFSDSIALQRWLLLEPKVRGIGLGRRLVEDAVAFCKSSGYTSVLLWTFEGLVAAEKLGINRLDLSRPRRLRTKYGAV